MDMTKKHLAILVIPIVILACKKPEPATSTDTGSTETSMATATETATDTIAPPVPHEIDHYKFWSVKPVKFSRAVKLKGQFDDATWEARLLSIEYLGNPVEKTVEGHKPEGILHPEWHLVAYRLKAPPQPPRKVVIENQFRKGEIWQLTDAAWLLVPASKSLEGQPSEPPKEADHYVCYVAGPMDPITTPVQLVDQFDKKRQDAEKIEKLQAAFLCVPVSKDGGQFYRPKEHLALYKLDPPDAYPIRATTRDQFGRQRLNVVQSELLAVPTWKEWKKE
jgi:hypothetical protein